MTQPATRSFHRAAAPARAVAVRGVVAAALTPCRAPGEPDPDGMRRLCRHLAREGCNGIFVISSTGEMPLLDEEERRELIAAAREGAGPGVTLYAGISGTGLRQTLRYARHAAADGADVAIAMAPFFLRLAPRELEAYMLELAEQSPIPLGLYHHLRMPSEIAVESVARLARHPNLVAMKDTSVDVDRLRDLVEATRGTGVSLFQGSELLIRESLQMGAQGCVTALAGIAPAWHRELFDAFAGGDEAAAETAQERITRLAQIFRLPALGRSFAHFSFALRRAAVARKWIDSACGMVPGFEPDPAFEREVLDHLCAAGLLENDPQQPRT